MRELAVLGRIGPAQEGLRKNERAKGGETGQQAKNEGERENE
jgi:hypothetical protein